MGERMQLLHPDQTSPNTLCKGQLSILNSGFSGGGRCIASQLHRALLCPRVPMLRVGPCKPGLLGYSMTSHIRMDLHPPSPPTQASRLLVCLPPLSEATGALVLIRFEAVKSHLRLY